MSMAPGQPEKYAQQGVPTMMTQPGAGWPFYDERIPVSINCFDHTVTLFRTEYLCVYLASEK